MNPSPSLSMAVGLALLVSAPKGWMQPENPLPEGKELYLFDGTADVTALESKNATLTPEKHEGKTLLKFVYHPSEKFSHVRFAAPDGVWDLSPYQAVQVEVTNAGSQTVKVVCRVENPSKPGSKNWVNAVGPINPGSTKTITVRIDGGSKNQAYKLDPTGISAVQISVTKPDTEGTLLIHSLKAIGVAGG